MSNGKNVLLVEGESDKSFFEAVCKLLNLTTKIQVAPPREIGGQFNSKQGVFDFVPELLKQLPDGQLTRLAVIVDADSKKNGSGFQSTIDKMVSIVTPFGFGLRPDANLQNAGIFFRHSDGLSDIGFWVMPNNRDEGMLEDWIKGCVSTGEQALFQYAATITAALPAPKFKEIHRSKAEVATWLAWQKKPGHGAYLALKEGSIDSECVQFKQLASWLTQIYK